MAQLRSVPAIPIKKGKIMKTAILSDSSGQLFLEFLKGDRVATDNKDIKVYEGEVLPPTLVDAPAKPPRARMRELLSFEVISNTSDNLFFIDQYAAMNAHVRQRLSYHDTEKLTARQSGIQVLMKVFTEDRVGRPALWFYDSEKKKWYRQGGIITESAEKEIKVFSTIIFKTGTFTIWDENPSPDFNPDEPTHQEDIEMAEKSPYPSVEEDADDGTKIPAVDENFKYDRESGTFKRSAGDDEYGNVDKKYNNGYQFKKDDEFIDPKDPHRDAFLKEGYFIDGSTGLVSNGNETLTKEEYITKYGINDKTSTEEEGFNVYDNFYNTFDTYLGKDEDGNPIKVPSLDDGRSVNRGGNKFDDKYLVTNGIVKNISQENNNKNQDNFSHKPDLKKNKSGFTDNDFKNAAPLLQANLFDSDLASTGPDKIFNFPWYIVVLFLIFGSSMYIVFSKKY